MIDPSDRTGSIALLVATVGMLATMGLHPTGPETLRIAEGGGGNVLARSVHLLALAMQPPLLFGLWTLNRRLRGASPLADLALCAWGVATVCVVIAGAASGLIATHVVEGVANASGTAREWQLELLHFTGTINRAFATLFTVFAGSAIALWAWVMRRSASGFPPTLAWIGLLVGSATALAPLGGLLRLDVRGFGLVVIGLAIWLAGTALVMRRPAIPRRDA